MSSEYFAHPSHSSSGPHHGSQLPYLALEIIRGKARHKVRPIEVRAFLIGSAPDSDLVLADPQFPSAYAYVLRKISGVSIRFLGLGPELTVNGSTIHNQAPLANHDRLRMGSYEFKVHLHWPQRDGTPREEEEGSMPFVHSLESKKSFSFDPQNTLIQSDSMSIQSAGSDLSGSGDVLNMLSSHSSTDRIEQETSLQFEAIPNPTSDSDSVEVEADSPTSSSTEGYSLRIYTGPEEESPLDEENSEGKSCAQVLQEAMENPEGVVWKILHKGMASS